MAAERIDVSGTFNFRDVGGYACSGGVVKTGVLFRSDGLARVDDAGRAVLAAHDVRTVIDLRDEYEVAAMPDALDGLDVTMLSLPVFEGSGASHTEGVITLEALYERMVVQHASVLMQAIRDIAEARDGAVVVHCTAGKDRTGVVIALALLAIGVPRDVVVEDYAATQANLAGDWLDAMVARLVDYDVPDTPQIRMLMGGSPATAMDSLIDLLEQHYGSVREYLLSAGLTLGELGDLETRLVDRG